MSKDLEELVLSISADNRQMLRALRKLEGDTSKSTREIERRFHDMGRRIDGSMSGVGKAVSRDLEMRAQVLSGRLGPLGTGIAALGPAGLTAAAGIGALVLGLGAGISSAAEADRIFRRLDAVLKAAGGAAGLTATQINQFAGELQHSTGIAVDEINAAAAALATYTNISGERFKGVIKLSSDMVAVYGGNLREWADKIARAIDDPIQGFAALKRAGFQLTDAQLDLVEGMRKVGDVAGYQSEMIKILSDSLGGTAGEQGKGLAGSFTRAKDAAVRFLEEMARWKLIQGPVEGTINAIADGLENLADRAERMRKIEIDVGINVVDLNRQIVAIEDRIANIRAGKEGSISQNATGLIAGLEAKKAKLERDMEALIEHGHKEVAELAKVQTGERLAQWGAATDLIKDNAKAAEEAGKAYLTAREKLSILGQTYDDTKSKIAQARELWKASAADLVTMSAEEKGAYEARGKAIEEWAASEESAYQRHSAALQKQIENEAKRAESARSKRDEVKSLISDLEHELAIIGKSNTEQRISNELRRLGASATKEQRDHIAALITEIDRQREAQEAANKAQKDFQDGIQQMSSDAVDALGQVISGTEDAADAFKRLAIEIVKSALTGKGAYADFFASLTGGGGSLLGLLFGSGGGFTPNTTLAGVLGVPGYSEGTNFHPGGLAVVGEKGPELLNLPRGAQVIPQVPRMPDLVRPAAAAANQDVHVTVGWSRSADGNLKPFIEEVSQNNVKAGLAQYDKGSAYRAARDLREVNRRGYGA